MLNRVAMLAVFALLMASAAHAAPGVALRWNACIGDAGVENRYFACNTNQGVETLVASFELATDMLETTGIEFVARVHSATATLPAWWEFRNTGTCRTSALTLTTAIPADAVACSDWAQAQAQGGIGSYAVWFADEYRQFAGAIAVPANAYPDLYPGQEYFAFALRIQHTKTVGTGACGGCCVPVNLVLVGINVFCTSPYPQDVQRLGVPSDGFRSQWVTWQGGFPEHARYAQMTPPPCGESVPTRARTWSELKALYR